MPRHTRRTFLRAAAGVTGALTMKRLPGAEAGAPPSVTPVAAPLDLPAGVKITAITTARYAARHPRKIGRNSFKDHGAGHDEQLVRVQTSAGVEGLGNAFPPEALGRTLDEFLEVRDGKLHLRPGAEKLMVPNAQGVLLDLAGKLTKRPAAELLGPIVRRQVPCYDGSIYMRELDDGDDAIRADTANGLEAGHLAFKVKIGRGRWLKDRARGYERDLWAIQTVRATAGERGHVLVDANNYYNLEESLRLLKDTASVKLYWMEEMFEEKQANHKDYRALRDAIRERKLATLLADGESGRGDGDLLELLKAGVIQVAEPDIRTLGIFAYRDYAAQVQPTGASVSPHAWAKLAGVVECGVLGMVVPNFERIEDCRLSSGVVTFPELRIRDGQMTLGALPGMGMVIDETAYQKQCAGSAKTVKA